MMGPFIQRKYAIDKDKLTMLRDAGMGVGRIAKIFGCNNSTVRNALIRHGLPTRIELKSISTEELIRQIKRYQSGNERRASQ